MSEKSCWDSSFKSGEFSHWETYYPSPELASLVAAGAIAKKARILDIGTGGGLDAIFLAECGFEVVAVDFSRTAIKIAKKRATKIRERIHWVLASAFSLPFREETFDFASDRGLFHIIEDTHRSKYAAELFRILKLYGRLIIRGSNEESAASDRFNPITEESTDHFFSKPRFQRGPVVPIPLTSSAGVLDGNVVVVKKIQR